MLCSWVPEGDGPQRQGVADARLGPLAGDDGVTDAEALGHEDVALLAVGVVEQADARRAVGVVLDGGEAGRHVELVAPEVDAPVVPLGAAAAMAHRQAALPVAARAALHGLDERLVRRVGGDLLEGRPRHEAATRGGRLVAADGHGYTPSKNSIESPALTVTMAFFQGDV